MIVPYLGEKSKFSNFIIPNIPTDISTYVEPFGGMFGIFFSLDFSKYKDTKFVYNDVNYLNYNLFNFLRYVSEIINAKNNFLIYKSKSNFWLKCQTQIYLKKTKKS